MTEKKTLFTLGDLFFILLAIFIIIYRGNVMLNTDGDILWHIKQGEWYIENRSWYLDRELFSFLFEFREWAYLSWLGDVIFASIYKYFGFKGLILFVDYYIVVSLYIAYRYLVSKKINYFVIMFYILAMLPVLNKSWTVRNHIFIELFIVLFFIVFERYYEGKDRYTIYLLPIINILWVNMHGSFLYGMMICAFFAIGALYDYIFHKEKGKFKQFIVLSGTFWLLFLTSLINPINIRFYINFFTSESMKFLKPIVGDFISPTFTHGGSMVNLAIVLSVSTFILFFRRVKVHYLLIMLYLLMTGLVHQRNISVFGAMMILILPQLFNSGEFKAFNSKLIDKVGKISDYLIDRENRKIKGAIGINIVITTLILLFIPYFSKLLDRYGAINPARFPVGAIEYLKENRETNNGYHSYVYGGYITWNFYPERLNYLDTRGSIFTPEEHMEAHNIKYLYSIDEVTEKYNITWFLVGKNRDKYLYNYIKISPDRYDILYEDNFDIVARKKISVGKTAEEEIIEIIDENMEIVGDTYNE
ncbi:MAG: hypothetical protein GX287_00275 [Fusobacteria bacterium]|nr:hypothetical protein [Fusobacteriota bacterium]